MIENISQRLAVGLKKRVPDHPASIAVFRFTIAVLINTVAIILLTISIGLWTGRFKEVCVILVSFALLRVVSGGIHLKSGDKCVVVTTALFTAISLIDMSDWAVFSLNSLSILLAYLFAPSRIEKQSKIDQKHYPKLKFLSIILIATNFLFMSSILAVTFFVQCITLIKLKEVKR
ncbi:MULTISPECIES: accessory gene regulator ArgB-like protein [unclassified Paenibacillus]|uniref:accessory gene regulator ArgB-like protein n=1 Tax=unclassified Paenibacillus TaxID=185978 RepID=UPI0009A65321|nr:MULTISPECIES: accessory gene regulator B family protein [unclassified Paenibacillus]SLJ98019.1 accessory gene regulator B [Paenibacillus sp. RU5A]SOC66831.1 accessory gene regulator B [Paenibacillus sp. RU26A]SOC70020.1 accessory gene regulator B [Paenibacillus sp. RU5M]